MAGLNVVSDSEVIRHILQAKGQFVMYLGAGVSAEAGVKTATQICEDIRTQIIRSYAGSPQAITTCFSDRRAPFLEAGQEHRPVGPDGMATACHEQRQAW